MGHLASKARDTSTVNLSGPLFHAARKMAIDAADDDSIKLIQRVDSVQVRSFEFATDDAYSSDDISSLRRQLDSSGWTQVIRVRDREQQENIDVYLRVEGERALGLAVIVAEPRELTIVNIAGSLSLDDFARLQGQYGIPKLQAE
jgi:outer membrane translocation and assembly module TamA